MAETMAQILQQQSASQDINALLVRQRQQETQNQLQQAQAQIAQQQAQQQAQQNLANKQQAAYDLLNRLLEKTQEKYGPGIVKGGYVTDIREAFAAAGLDPRLGESLYVNTIKGQAKAVEKYETRVAKEYQAQKLAAQTQQVQLSPAAANMSQQANYPTVQQQYNAARNITPTANMISTTQPVIYMKEPSKLSQVASSVSSKVGEFFKDMGSAAEEYISLGGALKRQPVYGFGKLVGESTGPPLKQTMTYSYKGISPEQRLQRGEINQTEYQRQVLQESYWPSFFQGAVLGSISAIAPPIGLTLGGLTLGKTVTEREQIIPIVKQFPKESLLNVAAGMAGAAAGSVGTTMLVRTVKGELATAGRQYVPIEQLTTKEVISGEKKFPEAPFGTPSTAQSRLQYFRSNPYPLPGETTQAGVYHATPYTFAAETKTVKGTSEVPGLYVSPAASTYFLKLGNDFRVFGLSQESILSQNPSILRIYPKDIELFKSIAATEPGTAYVLNIKPEIEAIIPPETPLTQTSGQFYTTIEGTSVPINQYNIGEIGKSLADISGTGYKPMALITPSTAAYSFSTIKPISSVSTPSSFKIPSSISSISSVKTSKISGISLAKISSPSVSFIASPSVASSISISSPSFIASPSPSSSVITAPPSYVPAEYTLFKKPKGLSKEELLAKAGRIFGKGYKTYFYLKGKKIFLPGIAPRTEAIKKGEFKVLQSISARFGIERTNIPVRPSAFEYNPSEKIFRGYKIRGTARIPTPNEWIQKAGTRREPTIGGARLGSRAEVRELLSFRKSKGGLFR